MQKAFGGVNAIDNVSLEIRRGEILGLIGPNGSGKTTLVNLISGVYAPDGGEVWFAGEDITKLPPYKISRMGMARTFQNVNLVGDMSALDNVAVARASASKASMRAAVLTIGRDQTLVRAREHAMALLETVGASDAALQSCDSLPYGVKRHVEIARALALEPQLVLLDEPAAGLNDAEQMDLAEQLKNLPDAGITLLVIEHNMRFLLTLAERIVCLDHGEIIAQGSPEDIVSNPAVIEAYLGTADETSI
jgi:ABC-type branched-subunit amino acid transport system ATPase component